jgi:hypothetical protein
VRQALKITLAVVGALLTALWCLFSFRLVALPIMIALVVILSRPSLRSRLWLLGSAWVAVFVTTIQPFDVTLRTVPGGPHIITWCPGSVPYRDYRDALERDRRGECRFRTDLFAGYEATYYLVW